MNRGIDKLHPSVRERFQMLRDAAIERGINFVVTSTHRTDDEQQALYSQGRKRVDEVNALRKKAGLAPITPQENRIVTNARTSVHQFGCAFDVVIIDEKGNAVWDAGEDTNGNGSSDYSELGAMGEAAGLVWGGRFPIGDLCHFEYTGGLTIDELMAGMRPEEECVNG